MTRAALLLLVGALACASAIFGDYLAAVCASGWLIALQEARRCRS